MNIAKEIKTIQAEAEKELGFPLLEAYWKIVEDDVGNAATDYDGDPEGQEEYIENYRNVTTRDVELLKIVWPSIKAKTSTDGNGEPANPKKIYRKPLERRLHLLDFVLNKKGSIKARAHWKQISAEWNKEHPYDRKDQAVLKVEYCRALKDYNVTINYATMKIAPFLKEGLERVNDFWRQHPEAKNLNELIEMQETQQ